MTPSTVIQQGAKASLVLVFFAFPMSVALANVGLLLTLVFWLLSLFSAPARSELLKALRNPLTAPALALFAWVVIAIAWSPASTAGALGFLQKYLKFLLVPMFIALLQDARTRRLCWHAFILALLFTLAVTWLSVWVDIPWTRASQYGRINDHTVFKDHIAQGLMMTVLSVICATTAFVSGRPLVRWFSGVVWLLAIGSILLLSEGRTGYLAVASATAAFAFVMAFARSRRAVVLTAAGLMIAATMAFAFSPVLKQRLTDAWHETQSTSQRAEPGEVTSAGARVEMTGFVLQAWREAPMVGHGTASYPVLAAKHFTSPGWCSVVCPHPHNQFLFFLVEQGVVGLLLFLWFIAAIVREGWRHDPPRRAFALAFVTALCVASLTHSAFWLSTESHCLILMSALTMASLRARRGAVFP